MTESQRLEILNAPPPWFFAGWSQHVSPSSLGRINACIRSEAMPHSNEDTEVAGRGTVAHQFLADCLDVGRDLALGKAANPKDIEWLELIDVERLPAFDPLAYAPEVAIAYNVRTRTARELGRNISREEAYRLKEPDEIVGIIDVAGCTDTLAVVGDYKTGWIRVPAEGNWQLMTYALFMARCYGKTGAFGNIIRVLDNGFIGFDTFEMDELDLITHEEALLALLQKREDVRALTLAGKWSELPQFREGKHCRYCPARWSCPAKTFGIKELVAEEETVLGSLTPESAGRAWQRLKHVKQTVERYESVLRELARTTPLPLFGDSEGEVLGEKEIPKESIVPSRAKAVLERQYGPLGVAIAGEATEVEETMTKAALRSSIKKLLLPTLPKEDRKITYVEKDIHKLLKAEGAMSIRVERQIREHRPQKKALPEASDVEEAA